MHKTSNQCFDTYYFCEPNEFDLCEYLIDLLEDSNYDYISAKLATLKAFPNFNEDNWYLVDDLYQQTY